MPHSGYRPIVRRLLLFTLSLLGVTVGTILLSEYRARRAGYLAQAEVHALIEADSGEFQARETRIADQATQGAAEHLAMAREARIEGDPAYASTLDIAAERKRLAAEKARGQVRRWQRSADYHAFLRQKYRRLAAHPWEVAPPDPPFPVAETDPPITPSPPSVGELILRTP